MEDVIKQVKTHKRLISHIISRGHQFFGMEYPRLYYRDKSDHASRRFILAVLKNFTLATEQDICDSLIYSSKRSMWSSYQTIKDELSGDLYGSDKTKFIYKQLINYLKLQDNDTTTKGT
jgi:hypothetical protein